MRIKGKKDGVYTQTASDAEDVQDGFLIQKANLPVDRESSDRDGIRQLAAAGPSRKGTE